MVLCVQNVVFYAFTFQKTGDFFRLFNRRSTDQNGLAFFVTALDFVNDFRLLAADGGVDFVGVVDTLYGTVGGDFHNVQRVDGSKFRFFRLRRTRHTRQFLVQTEVVLEGNRCPRFVFAANFQTFLRFDGLVQTVRITSAVHQTAREFVNDNHFAFFDDVVFVQVEEFMRFQCLLNVVVQVCVCDFCDVVDVEEFFRLR